MEVILSNSSKETLKRAQTFSLIFGKKEVDCEALFYAICIDRNSFAFNILVKYINIEELLNEYKNKLGKVKSNLEFIPFSSSISEVEKIAKKTCEEISSEYICDEHLLYGILSIKSFADLLFKKFGIDANKLRENIYLECKEYKDKELNILNDDTAKFVIENQSENLLNTFASNMNLLAINGAYEPLIGRQDELDLLIKILCRKNKNNAIILGEAGVGKTHLVEGLAQKINRGEVPIFLSNYRIFNLNLGSMIAGSKLRGQFEERLYGILNEIKSSNNFRNVLFIDEIHMIMGAGDPMGSMDVANILKPALSRGEIQIIGATTFAEYKNSIEKDKAMSRRFQTIKYSEASRNESVEILKGIKSSYEAYHLVKINDDILEYIVDNSIKYIPHRYLPDKAIELLDQVAANVKINNFSFSDKINAKREKLKNRIEKEIKDNNLNISEKSKSILDNLNKEEEKWINDYKKNPPTISKKDVEKAILSLTGLNIINDPSKSLETLKNNLKDNIINQDESINSIINSLYKSQAQLAENNKPIGSFLFIGKSGVGKTYLSELLASFWFGENHLIRFDMSEFAEKEKVSRLLGTTPGYIGYDVGGQLIEEVNKKPNSVILFDEIDKAHPDVINIFLQILDDGKITDGSGKIADFKNSIIIFTSNIGGISNYNSLGFGSENISEGVEDSAKKYFRIEFLNRLNKIIQFNDLSRDDIQIIFNKEIEKINEKLKAQQIKFEISEKLRDFVLNKINPSNGAREIKRRIDEYIVDFLSKKIIINKLSNTSLVLDLDSQEKIFIK